MEIVSVIIPLYNHEAYIEECLNSVLAQEMSNIELLLLDDGSTDKGFDVACKWRDAYGHNFRRIEFDRQANAGIACTFDRLIRKSSGKFITILASDDMLVQNSIAMRLELLNDDRVRAVFGDAIPIDELGNIMGKSAISELGIASSKSALSNPTTLPWELIFRWNVYGSVLLCRRDDLMNGDGSSSIINLEAYSEDMQIYYKLASRGVLRYLDCPVAYYRIHPTNSSRVLENITRLRRNIYDSRRCSLGVMSPLKRVIVSFQICTYYRWERSIRTIIFLPYIFFSYGCIFFARIYYDFFRKRILRQPSDI